jgi:hypothetical protein
MQGIDPSLNNLFYEIQPIPCKCGISHEHGDGNYEFFDMKMVADNSPVQLPPRRTARCKFCKEVLLVGRKDDRKKVKEILDEIPEFKRIVDGCTIYLGS